ncbi:YebG family protein [Psychrobium sp. MM17-31]|uniref:YebG family protein n=1 Tax=Psychrobium sp. MM17-31 TaxID=2917758 RepID=UPI001EF70912|nr:YebG family protein [Psychrobium sp. MM17-31]MCG7531535.1 YebG family protein [Psychrobium sp. MM17-31]
MIEIEYIVKDKRGVEKLRTADKKAADAYDKALDNAELLQQLLRHDNVLPKLKEDDLETLTIYLALNAKNVEKALKGKQPELSGDEADGSNVTSIEEAS